MATLIQLRRGTRAQWLEHNPVLALGEPGFETDTQILRIGDGKTAFADLPEVVNVQSCDIVLNEALEQISTLSSSVTSLIDNKLQAALLKIENQTTNRAVFCVNSGRTDENGNPNFVLQSLTKIKAIAPFTYTTASGISHTTDEDLWYDSSELANGDYNLFVNFDGEYKLIVLANTIYRQNELPVGANENDIWLNTATYPQVSYILTHNHWIQTDYVPIGNLTQSNDLPGDEIFDALPEDEETTTPEVIYFDFKLRTYEVGSYYDSVVVNMNVTAEDGSTSSLTHTFTSDNQKLSFKEGEKVSITSISDFSAKKYTVTQKLQVDSHVDIGSNELESSGIILGLTDNIVIDEIDLSYGPINIPFYLSVGASRADIVSFDDGSCLSISASGQLLAKCPGSNYNYNVVNANELQDGDYYLVVGLINGILSFNLFSEPQTTLSNGIETSLVRSKIKILNNNKILTINLCNATYIDESDTEIPLAQFVDETIITEYTPADSSIVLYTDSTGSSVYNYGTAIDEYTILYANFVSNPPEEDYEEEDEPSII